MVGGSEGHHVLCQPLIAPNQHTVDRLLVFHVTFCKLGLSTHCFLPKFRALKTYTYSAPFFFNLMSYLQGPLSYNFLASVHLLFLVHSVVAELNVPGPLHSVICNSPVPAVSLTQCLLQFFYSSILIIHFAWIIPLVVIMDPVS